MWRFLLRFQSIVCVLSCHSWHSFTFNFQFIKCDFGILWHKSVFNEHWPSVCVSVFVCVYSFPFFSLCFVSELISILTIQKITRQWNWSNSSWIYNNIKTKFSPKLRSLSLFLLLLIRSENERDTANTAYMHF